MYSFKREVNGSQGFDLLSLMEEFSAMPPQPRVSRIERPSHRKLKRRTYRCPFTQADTELLPIGTTPPASPNRMSSTPPYNSKHSRKFTDCTDQDSAAVAHGLLTPPRSSRLLANSNSFSAPGGKRRKTIHDAELGSGNTDDRHQLVLQMQLMRTNLEDEEALIWSSSEGEDADSESEDRENRQEKYREAHMRKRRGWPVFR